MTKLPSGWISVELNDVLELRLGRVSPSQEPSLPYIGLEQIEAHTNRILGTISTTLVNSSAIRFQAGDVLYGRMRPYLNKVATPQIDGLASAEFIVFAKTPYIDSTYLKLRLCSSDFLEFACSQIEGDRPRVKFEQLGKFDLWLPPYAEQLRIAKKLESVLASLDASHYTQVTHR